MAAAAMPTEPAVAAAGPELEQVASAFPQFEVLGQIGRGGMGSVFKVRQPKLNRLAALKLLPDSLAADPAFAGRFEREAQVLARLNHPNIVAVYDYGQAEGFFYLLMEFVDGVNLRQAMKVSRFTPEQALGIVPKICEALQFAHDEGVLHRDIKPENLLLDSRGRVKLADFGIAKLAAEAEIPHGSESVGHSLLTQAGAALGTPSYMAPEQRDRPSDVDHRADIYSLGVVFYELLTGELPQQSFTAPSTKSAADPRVDAIVRQALEKDPHSRQRSAGELRTQVETLAGEPSQEEQGGHAPRVWFAHAAVAFSLAGTWMSREVTSPKSVSQRPVTVTAIGLGEPWLAERRWLADAPVGSYKWVGGVVIAPTPWQLSEVAMVLAGISWALWFLFKRRAGERLDALLANGGRKPSFASAGWLWLGASAFGIWLLFAILGLAMLPPGMWRWTGGNLPFFLQDVFKVAVMIAGIWVTGNFVRRWKNPKEALPPPSSWPARLVVTLGVVILAALSFKVVWSSVRREPARIPTPAVQRDASGPKSTAGSSVGRQDDPLGGKPAELTTDVRLELIEKTSVIDGDEAREVRQVAVIAEKPGFLHLWADGLDPLIVPLLPDASGKGYRRNLFYSVGKAERPQLNYQVITDNTQKEAKDAVDLANQHITFDKIAKNFREIADPVGKCLRNVPLDLVHLGDYFDTGSLWLAVSDSDAPLQPEQWYLHIWHPTYYSEPPSLPAGLLTHGITIGAMIKSNDQTVGRISQRDGRFMADLAFSRGSTSYFKGELKPEVPLEPTGVAFSGAIWPVRFVLTKKSEVIPFLEEQLKLDQQKRKKP
ncbi:serine/threonine-protein kinase [Luteolibacter soli]